MTKTKEPAPYTDVDALTPDEQEAEGAAQAGREYGAGEPAPGSLNARIAEIDRDPDLTPEEADARIAVERKLWEAVHGRRALKDGARESVLHAGRYPQAPNWETGR